MRILLDTHALLWFVLNDARLSDQAGASIHDAANSVFVSPASHWETAIKVSAGKYRLNANFEEFWRTGMSSINASVLPIEINHTAKLITLPFHHKDPFDRLLVAQALAEQISIVSGDAFLDAYGILRIW